MQITVSKILVCLLPKYLYLLGNEYASVHLIYGKWGIVCMELTIMIYSKVQSKDFISCSVLVEESVSQNT